jgi:hypothetical protein
MISPTSTTSDGDQYDAYARVVMELLYGMTAVFRLYFAIDPNRLDDLIKIAPQRPFHHVKTRCPRREHDTSGKSALDCIWSS